MAMSRKTPPPPQPLTPAGPSPAENPVPNVENSDLSVIPEQASMRPPQNPSPSPDSTQSPLPPLEFELLPSRPPSAHTLPPASQSESIPVSAHPHPAFLTAQEQVSPAPTSTHLNPPSIFSSVFNGIDSEDRLRHRTVAYSPRHCPIVGNQIPDRKRPRKPEPETEIEDHSEPKSPAKFSLVWKQIPDRKREPEPETGIDSDRLKLKGPAKFSFFGNQIPDRKRPREPEPETGIDSEGRLKPKSRAKFTIFGNQIPDRKQPREPVPKPVTSTSHCGELRWVQRRNAPDAGGMLVLRVTGDYGFFTQILPHRSRSCHWDFCHILFIMCNYSEIQNGGPLATTLGVQAESERAFC
ncbi:hypothetical protein EDB89DRAFT_2196461 [Lactarius sanguifluus]|nr:hypothetical protein EDB89DRAFT_2196461 [Lactarius sanguifluus]